MLKRAIITGSSGFIGSALVKRLIEKGTEVIGIDIYPSVHEALCETVVADVTSQGALDKFLNGDTVVFHLSANADVRRSVEKPRDDLKNTFCGLFEILESARTHKCKIVFPSTASIFNPSSGLPLSERGFVRPTSPYAAAKASAEAYCYAYHLAYNVDVRVARLFSVYGVGMNRFAIYDIVKNIRNNNKILRIMGDGKQIRDYMYIDDAIEGLLAIAEQGKSGEDYNLCSGIPTKIWDLAQKIATCMGYPDIEIIPTGKSFTGDVKTWYGDPSKIKEIGFSPKTNLDEGLQKTVEWILEHENSSCQS